MLREGYTVREITRSMHMSARDVVALRGAARGSSPLLRPPRPAQAPRPSPPGEDVEPTEEERDLLVAIRLLGLRPEDLLRALEARELGEAPHEAAREDDEVVRLARELLKLKVQEGVLRNAGLLRD
jgi:hypothetical protein